MTYDTIAVIILAIIIMIFLLILYKIYSWKKGESKCQE